MKVKYLGVLDTVVEILLEDESVQRDIQNLKARIQESEEPFIWSIVDIESFQQNLPSNIKSVWIFVLKKDTSSIAHYHPNSIQHTVMIEGKGKAKIGDNWEDLKSFNPKNRESWYVIDKNLPHEFYPEGHEMVVISFHTCLSKELIEIKSDSGEHRLYERSRNSTSNPYHSSEKWKIRHHIKPGDMGYLTYLHGILYAKEYGYNQAFEAYVASILSKFVQSFNPKKDRIWLAEIKNQIIGSIIIIGHSRVKAQLRCFLVHPDYRGLGLGKELIKEALQFCKECKYKTVFLFTESELGAARHLYACAGFRKIGEKTHKNWGKRVTEEKYDLNL